MLHAAGQLHADLELGNIFVSDNDEAIIADLGVSLHLHDSSGTASLDGAITVRAHTFSSSNPPESRRVLQAFVAAAGRANMQVPEALLEDAGEALYEISIDSSADVWAWGHCMVTLVFNGRHASKSLNTSILDSVARDALPQRRIWAEDLLRSGVSFTSTVEDDEANVAAVAEAVSRALSWNKTDRPTMLQIVKILTHGQHDKTVCSRCGGASEMGFRA